MALPGHKKYGGRKKGTPNKGTQELHEKLGALGFDPFTTLCLFGMGDWRALGYPRQTETKYTSSGEPYETDRIQVDARIKAIAEVCQYLYPKRKSIDHNDTKKPWEDRPFAHLTDEELKKK